MKSLLTLDSLTKLSAVLAASAYLGGFIVVNLHLSRNGFESLGFFQQHYLAASVWALLPAIAGFVLVSVGFIFVREGRGAAFVIGAAVAAAVLFVAPLFYLAQVLRVSVTLWWLACVLISALLIGVTKMQLDDLRRDLVDKRHARVAAGYNGLILLSIFVAGYFVLFSWFVFPTIPAVVGGGGPSKVQLVLDKEMPGLGVQQKVLDLFVATDKVFMVRGSDGRPIMLSRETVKAVVFPSKVLDAQPAAPKAERR